MYVVQFTRYLVRSYYTSRGTRSLICLLQNHSCDPNCSLNACYINEANVDKPLLAVFTRRDVEPGEELCFSYSGLPSDDDDDEDETPPKDGNAAIFIPCRCGAARCTGVRELSFCTMFMLTDVILLQVIFE